MENLDDPDDAFRRQYSLEQYAAELSPPQPDEATSIDADDIDAADPGGDPSVKQNHSHRMKS
jgi:hypothetical protein